MCRHHLGSEYGADLASSLSSPFYYKQVVKPLKPRESLLTIDEEEEESEGEYAKDGIEDLVLSDKEENE